MPFSRFIVNKLAVTAEVRAVAARHDGSPLAILCVCMYSLLQVFITAYSVVVPPFLASMALLLCLRKQGPGLQALF
jgi:hypothetical protein